LNFNEIAGFEDEGRVIPLEDLPKIEDILGITSGVLS
jgi:aconitate hydratase 2/2-methylisocitrate dehydratase